MPKLYWDSIEKGEPFRITPRMKLYGVVLAGLITLFLVLIFTRPVVEAILLRAPGALFVQTTGGRIENLYTLKLVNKTMRDLPVELKLENVDGDLNVMGEKNLVVRAGTVADFAGARVIGGGAGTTEEHLRTLAVALGSLHPSVLVHRSDTEIDPQPGGL